VNPTTATVSLFDNNRFSPSTVAVAPGGTVTWVWAGSAAHDVVSDSFAGSAIQTSGSFSATFTSPGRYTYYCSLHASQGMRGAVVVE
jgi:plastocyanin